MKVRVSFCCVIVAVSMSVTAVVSFWAGSVFQSMRYEDLCLDLGGGRNPGQYPICVVERRDR